MSGIGNMLEKRIAEAGKNPKKARIRGMLITGAETKIVGLRTEKKKREFNPISVPEGLCWNDGLLCIDRLCYTGCENCSAHRDIVEIKKMRGMADDIKKNINSDMISDISVRTIEEVEPKKKRLIRKVVEK